MNETARGVVLDDVERKNKLSERGGIRKRVFGLCRGSKIRVRRAQSSHAAGR
jgi:hypothetical protein